LRFIDIVPIFLIDKKPNASPNSFLVEVG